MRQVRCAIYTRKSSEEGLDQSFNSLQAQREACEAFVRSQRSEGWRVLPDAYDDGGLSGGTLERPALNRLLVDIDAGRVDLIVVYKIDRLTRSLADFAKLVERLEARNVSFVSVTQQFNTSTSMGRLTLNVLLSFAQFEREVTGERIRDKIAASKAKGMWMGGLPPLGYDVAESGLVVNSSEAQTVREIFALYLQLGSVRMVMEDLNRRGVRSKAREGKRGSWAGGAPFRRGALYHLLSNPIYIGRIRHRDKLYDGLHEPILETDMFEGVQRQLEAQRVARRRRANARARSPLAGKLFDETGDKLLPTHSARKGVRYRYYVSQRLIAGEGDDPGAWRLPAPELEERIVDAIVADPVVVRLQQRVRSANELSAAQVIDAVRRVEVAPGCLQIEWDASEAFGGGRPEIPADLTIKASFTQRRRGVEQRIVLDANKPVEPDIVLVKLVHRATRWVERLKAGASITQLAAAEGVKPTFLTQRIHLGLLSPRIVEALIDGRLPPEITAQSLISQRPGEVWKEQEQALLRGS
ncbi:MAG: recombinase family protein [Hyphomonadaceae bacterium]